MAGGRPPFYDSVEALQAKIDGYFEYIKGEQIEVERQVKQTAIFNPNTTTVEERFKTVTEKVEIRPPERPTITGLALYLGFTSRQAIMNYEEKPEFVDAIKTAKLRIEAAYEQAIFGGNAAGPIFALKNFGWTDKQEIDQKNQHSGEIIISWKEPDLRDPKDQSGDGELPSIQPGLPDNS